MKNQVSLSTGQVWILIAATVPMLGFGALGAWGTYTNVTSVFDRSATALGVVAAGEGATLVLALVMVGLTMLGQSSPAVVRVGLWALPLIASAVCAAVAPGWVEAVVFAVTPLAMVVSAEGLGLLARRIVVFRTGVDIEAQRRNADVLQALVYHHNASQRHPDPKTRKKSAEKIWKLAKKAGRGDVELGLSLVGVERERMTSGADLALSSMYGLSSVPVSEETVPSVPVSEETVPSVPVSEETVPSVSPGGGTLRVFLREKISENPGLSRREALELVIQDPGFGPGVSVPNFNKTWSRAKGDVLKGADR